MARTKQSARRSTKVPTSVELLEENQLLRSKVSELELEIEVVPLRLAFGFAGEAS